MSHSFDNWELALTKLRVGMRRRHWTGDPDHTTGKIVSIIGFSKDNLGWPIVTCADYPEPVVTSPTSLSPLKPERGAKLEQDTFF